MSLLLRGRDWLTWVLVIVVLVVAFGIALLNGGVPVTVDDRPQVPGPVGQ